MSVQLTKGAVHITAGIQKDLMNVGVHRDGNSETMHTHVKVKKKPLKNIRVMHIATRP